MNSSTEPASESMESPTTAISKKSNWPALFLKKKYSRNTQNILSSLAITLNRIIKRAAHDCLCGTDQSICGLFICPYFFHDELPQAGCFLFRKPRDGEVRALAARCVQ